jgi:multiple antibiotic resistance protein
MDTPLLGPAEILTLFFVTLGPLKLLGPFAQRTREMDEAALRRTALRVFIVALLAVILGGLVGRAMLAKFQVSLPALQITIGILFFLVALQLVLEQYASQREAPLPAAPMAATLALTFPLVVTPYGIAAVILLIATAADRPRLLTIFVIAAIVMLVNLLAMLFVRQIMRGSVVFILQVLGAVLGVLQVALAVEIVIRGLRQLGALEG